MSDAPTNNGDGKGATPVYARSQDRKVFDRIAQQQRRAVSDQFAAMLDTYCEVEGFDRDTGHRATPHQPAATGATDSETSRSNTEKV